MQGVHFIPLGTFGLWRPLQGNICSLLVLWFYLNLHQRYCLHKSARTDKGRSSWGRGLDLAAAAAGEPTSFLVLLCPSPHSPRHFVLPTSCLPLHPCMILSGQSGVHCCLEPAVCCFWQWPAHMLQHVPFCWKSASATGMPLPAAPDPLRLGC